MFVVWMSTAADTAAALEAFVRIGAEVVPAARTAATSAAAIGVGGSEGSGGGSSSQNNSGNANGSMFAGLSQGMQETNRGPGSQEYVRSSSPGTGNGLLLNQPPALVPLPPLPAAPALAATSQPQPHQRAQSAFAPLTPSRQPAPTTPLRPVNTQSQQLSSISGGSGNYVTVGSNGNSNSGSGSGGGAHGASLSQGVYPPFRPLMPVSQSSVTPHQGASMTPGRTNIGNGSQQQQHSQPQVQVQEFAAEGAVFAMTDEHAVPQQQPVDNIAAPVHNSQPNSEGSEMVYTPDVPAVRTPHAPTAGTGLQPQALQQRSDGPTAAETSAAAVSAAPSIVMSDSMIQALAAAVAAQLASSGASPQQQRERERERERSPVRPQPTRKTAATNTSPLKTDPATTAAPFVPASTTNAAAAACEDLLHQLDSGDEEAVDALLLTLFGTGDMLVGASNNALRPHHCSNTQAHCCSLIHIVCSTCEQVSFARYRPASLLVLLLLVLLAAPALCVAAAAERVSRARCKHGRGQGEPGNADLAR